MIDDDAMLQRTELQSHVASVDVAGRFQVISGWSQTHKLSAWKREPGY